MREKVDYIAINNGIRPMHHKTIKSIELNSAKFIYVQRDGQSNCERCGETFSLQTSKHLGQAKCPKCHRTFTTIHTWRRKGNFSIHWEVTGQAITEDILALRYYLVCREDGQITESEERARLILDFANRKNIKFENSIWDDGWKKSGRRFFREYGMSYSRNSLFCEDAKIRDRFFDECNKIKCLSKLDIRSLWENRYYASVICPISKKADIYEKLQKVGLNALAKADLNTYSAIDEIKVIYNKTSLVDMLGINRQALRLLKTRPTLSALKLLQADPTINEKDFSIQSRFESWEISEITKIAKDVHLTTSKLANYLLKQGASYSEYRQYVNLLRKANYPLKDRHYTMPRDIVAMTELISAEVKERELTFKKQKDDLIRAVSERISSNNLLKEFFNGNSEFIVVCPKSTQEFIEEGKAQHNCVGRMNYTDKQAREETLVLFVRERNNPQASFVTMEYCHGVIVQCMFDHNERVGHETKVYQFCDLVASRLRQANILVA